MPDPVYSPRTQTALADARASEDAKEQETRRNASRCGWCGQPMNGTTCCGAEPWRKTAA